MCWKCEEIDKKVLHYQTLSARVTDRLTLEGLQQLIEKLHDEKGTLHPESKKQGHLAPSIITAADERSRLRALIRF